MRPGKCVRHSKLSQSDAEPSESVHVIGNNQCARPQRTGTHLPGWAFWICCAVGGGIYLGLVLDLSLIDLEGTALADQSDYEHHWLISPDTGEIAFWTADTGIDGQTPVDLDELDLVVIDPLPTWVWYQDMADFADGITNEHAGRRLARAIQGKGAFRRFKDELGEEYRDLLPAWYAFRDARAKRRAGQWLADNSLIDDDSAECFRSGHPESALP
jgi:Uncharacterised protein family (UPF0158)